MEKEQVLEEILKALDERESHTTTLSVMLSYASEVTQGRKCAGVLKHLSSAEIQSEVSLATARGYIKEFASGRQRHYTITETGVAFLRNRGIVHTPPVDVPSLLKLLRHPDTKAELIAAIKPWYDEARVGHRSESSWWSLVDDFMLKEFQIFEMKVKGRKLAMGYQRESSLARVKKSSARELLESLFKNAFVW